MLDNYTILKRPLITEKCTFLKEQNKVLFEVDKRANKHQIKKAVEVIFKVKVNEVNTVVVAGKEKRYGRYRSKGSSWKKAIVMLAPGSKIDIFEGV